MDTYDEIFSLADSNKRPSWELVTALTDANADSELVTLACMTRNEFLIHTLLEYGDLSRKDTAIAFNTICMLLGHTLASRIYSKSNVSEALCDILFKYRDAQVADSLLNNVSVTPASCLKYATKSSAAMIQGVAVKRIKKTDVEEFLAVPSFDDAERQKALTTLMQSPSVSDSALEFMLSKVEQRLILHNASWYISSAESPKKREELLLDALVKNIHATDAEMPRNPWKGATSVTGITSILDRFSPEFVLKFFQTAPVTLESAAVAKEVLKRISDKVILQMLSVLEGSEEASELPVEWAREVIVSVIDGTAAEAGVLYEASL